MQDYDSRDVPTIHRHPYLDNTALIQRDPVYGLWLIHLERGLSPKEFDGMFTDLYTAKLTIDRLANARKAKKKEI